MTTLAPAVIRVRLTHDDFDQFHALVIRHRWDWPAVFSINPAGRIWPYVRRGLHPPADRYYIAGLSPMIDAIGEILLSQRDLGGRFFINEEGAWIKPEGRPVQFVAFEFTG